MSDYTMSDYRKIEIKCWRNGRVLFAHEAEGNNLRLTVEAAVKAGADLTGANLACAYLAGANLGGAHLAGAYLDGGEKLTGPRPILQVGPIGYDSLYLIAFLTDQGLRLQTGYFFGTREQFEEELADTHGDDAYAQEYRAALALIDAHERLWMPTDEASDAT